MAEMWTRSPIMQVILLVIIEAVNLIYNLTIIILFCLFYNYYFYKRHTYDFGN